jgi:bla regulator protein blaR1
MEFKSSTMQKLAENLGTYFDRPILDRTGIKGEFDFTLEYEIDLTAPVGDPSADSTHPAAKLFAGPGIAGPALFTALQEELGLKLEPTKAPVEVLVVDHLERPSEN